jgi:5-methylcytosine-specific restriction endonuclease McrA
MTKVFLLNADKTPLNPIDAGKARYLLKNRQAAVFHQIPFVIILKEQRVGEILEPLRVKIDPGSKTTGLALVNDRNGEVIWGSELEHRGKTIKKSLLSRLKIRRGRRSRKTRYRPARFDNRTRPKGWLPPSLQHRIYTILTWVKRLQKWSPVGAISQELVKFDSQLMDNPDIQGKEYQQGTLAGYETREYLLEKWNRKCAYCDVTDKPLQIEHIHPRCKGGSNRESNLTLACERCNIKKGTQDIKDFLKKDKPRLDKILKQTKVSLADSAAVNATKNKLLEELKALGLPVECGSGGLTKFNRTQQGLEKTHWIDAACVGLSTPKLNIAGVKPLFIKAMGHGNRQFCNTDKFGLPKRKKDGTLEAPRERRSDYFGFKTGDLVKTTPTKRQPKQYIARIAACEKRGTMTIFINGKRIGYNHKKLIIVQKKDGYKYS